MPDQSPHPTPLRERKRRRVRETIRSAALALFTERGFDQVTVADIAERAEVGRATFFRYFADKREVLFADSDEEMAQFTTAVGAVPGPIDTSLESALGAVRAIVVAYVAHITTDVDGYRMHQRLVTQHDELYARSLVKQRRYARMLADRIHSRGADRATAVLAAEIGIACFYAGQADAGDDPRHLQSCVAAAFDRLDITDKHASTQPV